MFKPLALFGLLTIGASFLGAEVLHEGETPHGPLWAASVDTPCGNEEPLTTTDWNGTEDHERRNTVHRACQFR